MDITCQSCKQVLSIAGPSPSFCPFCGASLSKAGTAVKVALPETAVHEAETIAGSSVGGLTEPQVDHAAPLQMVGDFRLLRELGQGGMGTVFEAEHQATGRRVALKLLSTRVQQSADSVERFLREARLAASLSHPRSTFVYGAGFYGDRPFIVMELMPGRNLRDVLTQEGPLPINRAVDYMLDVIEGLEAAHHLKVVHRDVKPSNCFLDSDGRVKVGDFGLSKSLVVDTSLTRTGAFLGTPEFAAPEQVRGEEIDHRTDVYAVGATLFYLISGRGPFTGDAAAVIARIACDAAPELAGVCPTVPRTLSRIIARTLEKSPDKRFRNLKELRGALLPYATGGTSIANVGRRVAALMVDNLAAWALGALVAILALPLLFLAGGGGASPTPGDMESQMAWQFQFQSTFQFAAEFMACVYFAFCEWRWGCGVGKLLMGLRVTDLQGQRPALWQAMLRTAFIPLGLGLALAGPLYMGFLARSEPDIMSRLATPAMFLLPLASWGFWLLCCVTARARNGYRGIHEFATGTRVVRLQVGPRTRPLRTPAVAPVAIDGGRFGPYTASGILATSAGRTVHVARDDLLGRPVWVQVEPQGTAPPRGRIAVTRPTRPHWLQGGTTSLSLGGTPAIQARWDAFEAVSGAPLPWAVHPQSGFTWEHGRVMLADLAEELAAGIGDGTLPPDLALEQIWVDRTGRVKVLDAPLKPVADGGPTDPGGSSLPASIAGDPMTPEKAVDLLRTAAELCTRHQRLPSHAHDFLAELARRPRASETLGWAACELKSQIGRPATIRWDDRLGMLSISMVVESQMYPLLAVLATYGLSEVFPSWPRAAFYAGAALLAVLIVALLGYFFRGGPFLQLLHTDLRRADGRPASRWRCMWRNLVTWVPFVVPYAPFTWLGLEMLVSMQPVPDDPLAGSPEQFLSMFANLRVMPFLLGGALCGELMMLAFAVGGILTLVFPQRALHDLLAGTCLVPK